MGSMDVDEVLKAQVTRESLLLRLKEESSENAWRDFYDIYGRLIFGYALCYGITYAEAEDIVQEVCIKVYRRIVQFDYSPERGRFRGWLRTITRNTAVDYLRRKKSRKETSHKFHNMQQLESGLDMNADDELWRTEWRKALYEAALERVRKRISPETLKIFNEYVLEQKSAECLANETSLDINSIYSVKHRVLEYIKQEVKNILENE